MDLCLLGRIKSYQREPHVGLNHWFFRVKHVLYKYLSFTGLILYRSVVLVVRQHLLAAG